MSAPQHARACEAARAIGGRLAAAGGALVALVSLLQHAPVTIACARGAATLVALALGTRFSVAALERSLRFDRKASAKKEAKA